MGSFASGFPAGSTPTGIGETTLLRLRFDNADVMYVIRWAGRHLAATEASPMQYAAMVPLQQLLDRSWAGWNIITEKKFIVDVMPPDAIRVRCDDKSVVAKRVSDGTRGE